MKKRFALLLAMALAFGVLLAAGCALEDDPVSNPVQDTPANADAQGAAGYSPEDIVAQVGEETITMAEYEEAFAMYAEYYDSMGYDMTSDYEMLTSFQDFIIDTLLSEAVVKHQAKVQGFTELTAGEQAELDELCADAVEDLDSYYAEVIAAEQAEDPSIDYDARLNELIAEEALYYTGQEMSYDEYIEWLRQSTTDGFYYDKLQQDVYGGVTVGDEEVEAWYNENITISEEAYTADPGLYKDDAEYVEMYGGEPVLYVPEGYSRIMHILLASETALGEDYNEKSARMADIALEYGELAFEDATGKSQNSAELAALLAEYSTLEAETTAMLEENLAGAKLRAEEAYAKLAGADFASVMMEYTMDTNFTTYQVYQQAGMLISTVHDSEWDWSGTVKEEFKKLSPGEYSGVFMDEEGYHIIYYVGDEPAGVRPLADVQARVRELLLSDAQALEWETLLAEWKNDDSVIINDVLVRSVGVG